MKSIQSKILLVVIGGLMVITAVVSIIAVNMTHEIMHRDADRILRNATQKEAAQINDVLGDVMKSVNIMGHYAITEVPQVEKLREAEFLADYLEKTEVMFTEIAMNTNGIEGFYLRMNPVYTNSTTGFYKKHTGENQLSSMPLTDLSKYPQNDTQNVGWYYEPVRAGTGIWLEPYKFPGYENLLITYAKPLYKDGNLIGVAGFDMNFEYLVQHIENISVYDHGHAVLIAKDGKTPYNTIPDNHSHNPHTESLVELKNGMYLEMAADYKDIQKDIHPMLSQIVFAFVAVLLVSIVYTIIMTQKIVGPLKKLTTAAQSLTGSMGHADIELVQVTTKDEIGTLSQVLNNTYGQIREYTAYINALAYRDSLTGTKNSTAYTEVIAEINKEICTGKPKFGVVVADINNLKQTNDKYGHNIGNELIIHTAKIITDIFKDSTVFRIGGDEFVVLLQNTDYQQYLTLLERMDEACSKDYVTVCERRIPISVARGAAIYDPAIDRVYEDVFAKADQTMYLNKDESKAALTC